VSTTVYAASKSTMLEVNEVMWHHSVNSSSYSINGDIAVQWEWSKFDP